MACRVPVCAGDRHSRYLFPPLRLSDISHGGRPPTGMAVPIGPLYSRGVLPQHESGPRLHHSPKTGGAATGDCRKEGEMKPLPLLLLAAMGLGVSSQPFSCYPRMRDQQSIKPFEKEMPESPAHQVPYAAPAFLPHTREQAAATPNPVRPTPEAISLGRIYYGYYCQMCHGENGKGDGAVGRSYVPAPTDLTSAGVRRMSDGEMAWAMVFEVGHEPALDSTVPLERRWHIIHFVRRLGSDLKRPETGEENAPASSPSVARRNS